MTIVLQVARMSEDDAKFQEPLDTSPDSLTPDGADVGQLTHSLLSVLEDCLPKDSASTEKTWTAVEYGLKIAKSVSDIHNATRTIARALHVPLFDGTPWARHMFSRLADLSREIPNFRDIFGLMRRTAEDEKFGVDDTLDCVLELARGVIETQEPALEALKASMAPALRLMANCCADNNINRSLIIHRKGVAILRSLALREFNHQQPSSMKKSGSRLILPTLYNVCADYDEPAANRGRNHFAAVDLVGESETEDISHLTLSEYYLGEFVNMGGHKPAVFMFLTLYEECLPEQKELLADIIELSSRAFLYTKNMDASFLQHIFGPVAGEQTSQSFSSQMDESLRDPLISVGTEIASYSSDAQASICQTWINVVSLQQMRGSLIRSAEALVKFVELPYLEPTAGDEDFDVQQYQELFLKMTYAISTSPEYASSHLPDSMFLELLTSKLRIYEAQTIENGSSNSGQVTLSHDQLSPTASILVLINNTLTDKDRIEAFLKLYSDFCDRVTHIILHSNAESIILPALKLATRLALFPLGAEKLAQADPSFQCTTHLLAKTTPTAIQRSSSSNTQPKHTFALQNEAIILPRLILKQCPSSISSFVHGSAFPAILTLSTTTISADIKAEITRLYILLLRNLASSQHPTTTDYSVASSLTTPQNLTIFISSLTFLIVSAPTPSGQSEALFGLGLFTSLFLSSSSTYQAQAQAQALHIKSTLLSSFESEKSKLLPILQRIAATKGQQPQQNQTPTVKADYDNLNVFLTCILSSRTSAESHSKAPESEGEGQEGKKADEAHIETIPNPKPGIEHEVLPFFSILYDLQRIKDTMDR